MHANNYSDRRFIMDNCPYIYFDSYNKATVYYEKENEDSIYTLLNIGWIILGISGAVVVSIGLIFIRRTVDLVFEEYDLVYQCHLLNLTF